MRYLVIFAVMATDSCSMTSLSINGARNDFKGQPLSAVQVRLGPPEQQQTIERRKIYTWFKGQTLNPCTIRVAMAGDVVDSYEITGDPNICSPWEYRPG
jgi:hypothetical protein